MEDIVGTFGPLPEHTASGFGTSWTAQKKNARGTTPNFRSKDLPNTWSFETKLWGDDEHPKERLCPKITASNSLQPPESQFFGQEHYELGFIRKSTNRRPNLVFEGSRSSTKRHKALTHDPLKEIRRETPSNRRIERRTKIAQKELQKSQKGKLGRTQTSLEEPHQIIYTSQRGSYKV
jgi:hypothetical protein